MVQQEPPVSSQPAPSIAPVPPLLQPLLGVHSAPSPEWLTDAAGIAAERGLGALYSLFYLAEASGEELAGQRPASRERMRALMRVDEALGTDLTTLKFSTRERPALLAVMEKGRALAVTELGQALPLDLDAERLQAAQRSLGIAEAWLAPLHWNGESLGLLLFLMPSSASAHLGQAELLGRHVAVALTNLREKEAGRKRGELDAVRWVYDEGRFLEQLGQEVRRAQRHKRPLSIMLLRLQNVDELYHRYGRFLTEQLLRQLGNQLAEAARDTDFLGAFGRDGFATILVEANREGAKRAQERVLANVRKMRLPNADLPNLDIELSCATATLPEDGETAGELTAAAEARLDAGATYKEAV